MGMERRPSAANATLMLWWRNVHFLLLFDQEGFLLAAVVRRRIGCRSCSPLVPTGGLRRRPLPPCGRSGRHETRPDWHPCGGSRAWGAVFCLIRGRPERAPRPVVLVARAFAEQIIPGSQARTLRFVPTRARATGSCVEIVKIGWDTFARASLYDASQTGARAAPSVRHAAAPSNEGPRHRSNECAEVRAKDRRGCLQRAEPLDAPPPKALQGHAAQLRSSPSRPRVLLHPPPPMVQARGTPTRR